MGILLLGQVPQKGLFLVVRKTVSCRRAARHVLKCRPKDKDEPRSRFGRALLGNKGVIPVGRDFSFLHRGVNGSGGD